MSYNNVMFIMNENRKPSAFGHLTQLGLYTIALGHVLERLDQYCHVGH